jgi:hypothetical protein
MEEESCSLLQWNDAVKGLMKLHLRVPIALPSLPTAVANIFGLI